MSTPAPAPTPGPDPGSSTAAAPAALDPQLVVPMYAGVVLLNAISALFSGLVLGLLSLDVTDLEILKKCGSPDERRNAAAIIPMRRHSNLLLCSLVIGNVIVNSALQHLLDVLFPGLVGFVTTTVCLTVFGEILPQAVCSRHGLAIGAKTIWVTWLIVLLTIPFSYPLSLILDVALGDEISFVYDRERLTEYLRITRAYNNLDPQEMNILTGALKIKKVSISHVMTKLKDVFMLELNTTLTYNTLLQVVKRGFSRVPVYERKRTNIVAIMMVKDLALINPYTGVSLKSLVSFYRHPLISVADSQKLDSVLKNFQEGKSHLALVKDHKTRELVGIVTLEDIIEEVLQVEINDETDVITDNRAQHHRPDAQIPQDLSKLPAYLATGHGKHRNPLQKMSVQRSNSKERPQRAANRPLSPVVKSASI